MPSRLVWTAASWGDYLYWQTQDRKTLPRINAFVQDAPRSPFTEIGKPEQLKENLSGFWSCGIDDQNRLVYAVEGEDLAIVACRYHCE